MSETFRKWIWCVLLILTVFALGCSFFFKENPRAYLFTGHGFREFTITQIAHLAPDDPVNTGGTELLTELPGVGPSIAREILSEREANGAFQYPEDLISVRGIGEKKLEQIRPMLTVLSEESED